MSCLGKTTQDPLLYQEQESPPPVIVVGEEEYEVEQVDDSRLFRRQLQYLLKGEGTKSAAGSLWPMWMDLRLYTTITPNNLASTSCEPCRYSALESGSYCHGCDEWWWMVEWWSVNNTKDNAQREWNQVSSAGSSTTRMKSAFEQSLKHNENEIRFPVKAKV
jgi:hypothetical protein